MKFAIVFFALVAAVSAQFNPGQYNPGLYKPDPYNPFSRNPFAKFTYTTPKPIYKPFVSSTPLPYFAPTTYAPPTPVPVAVVAKVSQQNEGSANIVKYGNELNPDGSYNFFYETENGIAAQEQGNLKNLGGNPPEAAVVSQGSYSFISPEGQQVVVRWTADENGFQPISDAIPTPHPIPEAIVRSLAYNAANPSLQK